MNTIILELSGYIQKQEELKSVETNIIPGTMVLQSVHPFGGYYSTSPTEYIPNTIFFITNEEKQRDEVSRLTRFVKKELGIDFDASRAEVTIHGKVFTALRLFDYKDVDEVLQIQTAYANAGVKFVKSNKSFNDNFTIKIWKVFLLEEIEKGVYLNKSKSKMFYFAIPKHLNYDEFKNLVKKVKNNWIGKSFDAGYAMLYRKEGVQEAVRIFSNHINDEMLKELPEKFKRYIE